MDGTCPLWVSSFIKRQALGHRPKGPCKLPLRVYEHVSCVDIVSVLGIQIFLAGSPRSMHRRGGKTREGCRLSGMRCDLAVYKIHSHVTKESSSYVSNTCTILCCAAFGLRHAPPAAKGNSALKKDPQRPRLPVLPKGVRKGCATEITEDSGSREATE